MIVLPFGIDTYRTFGYHLAGYTSVKEDSIMKTRIKRRLVAILAIPLVPAMLMFAAAALAGGSAGGTLSTGRSVMTYSDSLMLRSTFGNDTATIRTGGMTIVVKPTILEVDGVQVATIDNDVSNIEVRVKRGKVSFVADGKPVAKKVR